MLSLLWVLLALTVRGAVNSISKDGGFSRLV